MSILAIDVIDRLPGELAAALLSDPFFDDIPVAIAEKGNVIQEVQRLQAIITAKNNKWGVAVVVLQLVADDTYPEIAFGSMKLRPSFQVIEIPTQNNSKTGTGKSARKVARKIRDIIKPLALDGLCSDFVFEEECIAPVRLDSQNMIAYQVNCHTYEVDDEQLAQVATPQFSEANGQLILTCATEGAVIYYTTDESFPAPKSKAPTSTAEVYSSPIDIPQAGFIVRAMALPGSAAVPPTWVNSRVALAKVYPDEIDP
jgi:hypothetical protein